MAQVNPLLIKKEKKYLFSLIQEEIAKSSHKQLINLGIGDIAKPLSPIVADAFQEIAQEIKSQKKFYGYGPSSGYPFLKSSIIAVFYKDLPIEESDLFIADGICPDISDYQDLFSSENVVGIPSPTYPLYADLANLSNHTVVELPCMEENHFIPTPPDTHLDIIYLCSPNNPTGTVMTKHHLKKWVDYAKEHQSIILFDAAYEAFISDPNLPRSIYEIEGAEEVAIEFRSFSKSAGFTGLRCSWSVIPKQLTLHSSDGKYSVQPLWKNRQDTKTNGVSYAIQQAAAKTLTPEGQKQTYMLINEYNEARKILFNSLKSSGFIIYGGTNSPYLWVKIPSNFSSSWEFFLFLLNEYGLCVVPGSGFGSFGEGFIRLSSFTTIENATKAANIFNQLSLSIHAL